MDLSCGEYHACGIMADGALECWGSGGNGETEHPTTGTYTKVVSGGSHSCALSTDQKIVCWGDNSQGQAQVP